MHKATRGGTLLSVYVAHLIIFLVAAIPFFEVLVVIPLGMAAGLNALTVTLVAFWGNMVTIYLLILFIDHIQTWRKRRRERQGKTSPQKRQARAEKIWKKYGLPGLALLSPILIGSHLGTVLAMGFGGTKQQITFWMTVSILAWSAIIGVASYYGIDFFYDRMGRDGFLEPLLETE